MQPYHIPRLHGAKVSVSQIDCNLDRYLDRNPEDAPVYMGHSLFNTTKRVILLFSHSYIVIHLISGLKLSTSRFRLSVYKISQSRSRSRQNLLCKQGNSSGSGVFTTTDLAVSGWSSISRIGSRMRAMSPRWMEWVSHVCVSARVGLVSFIKLSSITHIDLEYTYTTIIYSNT